MKQNCDSIEIDPSSAFQIVDDITKSWGRTVVPFYVADNKSKHRLLGCGSGFLAAYKNRLYLVTALHVINDLPSGEALIANIGGKGVLINGLPFKISRDADIAVALLHDFWLTTNKVHGVHALPIKLKADQDQSLNIYILIGYPGAKNIINGNIGSRDRNLMGYSFFEKIENVKAKTHIKNPIGFRFDKKSATDSNGNRVDGGRFNGNSGGPVIESVIDPRNFFSAGLSIRFSGVFLGWDKSSKEIICARPENLIKLLEEIDHSINFGASKT
ncbi:serine protease family protein [Azohydromonas lata]|uniref:Trypsin-like peptidase domain-containing protein n=1 Tax=Azohydromonas lata TaxID=45677 RepID=A0ABU5IK24_9BURK|nr:hypothetical protein [Azohydromonas lata]MDZ5459249.1 hypothetical protein [Azohydromonas lata]